MCIRDRSYSGVVCWHAPYWLEEVRPGSAVAGSGVGGSADEGVPCGGRGRGVITASTTSAGNTFVSRPTDTRSGNRRSGADFLQPVRGMPTNYTAVTLIERYWACLLYTSDAADDLTRVDLGGRRFITKK